MLLLCSATVALGLAHLVPATNVQRTIAGGQTHTFQLTIPAGQFVTGVVDQGDTDLVVTVLSPDCVPLGVYDREERGIEPVSFSAPSGGAYRILVRPVRGNAPRVSYRLGFESFRPAAPDDARRSAAERQTTEAKQLFDRRDPDSLRAGIEQLERVLPEWRSLGVRSAELATQVKIAEGRYGLNQHAAAEEVFRGALPLSRQLQDLRIEAQILNGLAMIAWPRGDVAEALSLLDAAIARCRSAKFPYGEAAALSNRGILLWESGQYDEARQSYVAALAIVRTIRDRRGEAFVLNNLGMVLDELGMRRQAIDHLRRAVSMFRAAGDSVAEGRTLVSQARVQLALGESDIALANARRGVDLLRRSPDRLAEADGLRTLARVVEHRGDRGAARELYERALASYRAAGSRRGESEAVHALGLHALEAGDCATARALFQQALQVRRATGLRRLTIESLFRAALAERTCGTLERARAHLEAALTDAEQLRAGLFEKEQRTSYISARQNYYSAYIDVLMELHRRTPGAGFDALAFQAAERARGRELIERLSAAWTGADRTGDSTLIRAERELRAQINYWSWQLWQQADRRSATARDSELRARIDDLLTRHAEVNASIERADPRYAALRRTTGVAALPVIQQEGLDDDTVLLEYTLGEDRSYVWAITRDSATVASLPKRSQIEPLASELARLLNAAPGARGGAVDRWRRSAEALGRVLLTAVAPALQKRRIVIVPDGALHYVPFSALEDPTGTGPLIAGHDVITVPSATLLTRLRREASLREPRPKLLAVLADPVFDFLDVRVPSAARRRATGVETPGPVSRRLNRLAFGSEAAQRIFALIPPESGLKAVGFGATRALAVSAELAEYRILHFDTHAIQDDTNPDLSGIVLSLVDAAGREQDGFVRLHDVYSMSLQADLVVLAACRTGVGITAGTEGLASLGRAFLAAGAARVVSTLWDVSDDATAALTEHFYTALLRTPAASPAAALRTAQLAIRNDPRFRDPYYWAGVTLQGGW